MSRQYTKADALWTTVSPSALSALDISNISAADFRPTHWWGRPDEIFEQAFENDGAFLAFLESPMIPEPSLALTQPIVKYRVGRPADMHSYVEYAVAAADTYLELADSLIVRAGFLLYFNDYSTVLRVLEVDDDHSSGWQNAATNACNVKFERLTGPSVIVPVNAVATTGGAPMSEIGVPHRGTTTTPGDPVWNSMSMTGIYGSISRLQMESAMVGGWGTHPKIRDDIYFQHRYRKQQDLLFGQRYTGTDSQVSSSQLYIGAGVIPQIKTHVIEMGSLGINATWDKINDALEQTFDSELSGSEKHHFCGSAQFRDWRKAATAGGAELKLLGIESGVKNAMALGANSFEVYLQSGRKITVHELKKAFSAANMVDYGVTVDAANLVIGNYRGISEAWFENIEVPAQQITLRSDALIDTYIVCVRDESTMAVWRGGTRGLIATR